MEHGKGLKTNARKGPTTFEFPNVKFEHITGYKRSKNVATGNIRFYEGRYIQGVVAGLMTKTNKIGYIGAYPIAEVIMGINAFAQGLKSVNKDASISVIWANTWYNQFFPQITYRFFP